MKKKLLLFAFILFILPSVVFAKTVNVGDIPKENEDTEEEVLFTLNPGDVINYETASNAAIFIDEQRIGGCFGPESNCSLTYEVDKSLVLSKNYMYGYNQSLQFLSVDPGANIYTVRDIVDGHIYKTGDIIVFPHYDYTIYYYNENSERYSTKFTTLAHKLELYENNPTTWQLHIVEGTFYAPVSVAAIPFTYVKPQFKLTCEKDSINYGEKTSCNVSVISNYQLKEVSFSLDFPSFKVSNVKPAKNITIEENNSIYKFKIADGYGNNKEEFELMTFDLEGKKNDNYVDDINIINIQYKDELYEGSYDVLQSNLKVNTKKINNPNTYRNIAIILLPILVLFISFGIVQIKKNKKEKA